MLWFILCFIQSRLFLIPWKTKEIESHKKWIDFLQNWGKLYESLSLFVKIRMSSFQSNRIIVEMVNRNLHKFKYRVWFSLNLVNKIVFPNFSNFFFSTVLIRFLFIAYLVSNAIRSVLNKAKCELANERIDLHVYKYRQTFKRTCPPVSQVPP